MQVKSITECSKTNYHLMQVKSIAECSKTNYRLMQVKSIAECSKTNYRLMHVRSIAECSKTNYRLMQAKSIAECSKGIKHSAILSTFIKLTFFIKIFVLSIFEWPFYIGFTVWICIIIYGSVMSHSKVIAALNLFHISSIQIST